MTASALLEILERIRPEVVFAEIPRTHLHDYRNGSHGNVESIAVARYAESHAIEVVAVDLPEPENSFFQNLKDLSHAVGRTSGKFRRLIDANTERTHRGGFTYLNSDKYLLAWSDICLEELETVEYTRDPRLREIYKQKCDVMEQRDQEMLRNIRTYCASSALTRGVFLVGAAHRKWLIQKIQAANEPANSHIKWDISGSHARPS